MRPKQWIKNCFVLAPLLFTGRYLDGPSAAKCLAAALFFSAASSFVYIVNDFHDREKDRFHPKKKHRPLASGAVSTSQAFTAAGMLILVQGITLWFSPPVFAVIMGYIALNLVYTWYLKHMPVLDIFTIATFFVLRVVAGGLALEVPLSSWMFITTLCLALYLASIKRRQELLTSGSEGRSVLAHYTVDLVDRYAEMSATGALVFYSLFVISVRQQLVITIPFVLYGLYRYWYIVECLEGGESPTEALLKDWHLLATVGLWVAFTAYNLKVGGF